MCSAVSRRILVKGMTSSPLGRGRRRRAADGGLDVAARDPAVGAGAGAPTRASSRARSADVARPARAAPTRRSRRRRAGCGRGASTSSRVMRPPGPGAGHLRRRERVLGEEASHDGREALVGLGAAARGGAGRRGGAAVAAAPGARRGVRRPSLADDRERRADVDGGALVDEDRAQHAVEPGRGSRCRPCRSRPRRAARPWSRRRRPLLNHLVTVPSATVSPSWGIVTSAMSTLSFWWTSRLAPSVELRAIQSAL